MTRYSTCKWLRLVHPDFAPLPESMSPSAELERDALREIGDRDRPAVQAIFHARRQERRVTFFMEHAIAAAHCLSQRYMARAMDRLEGRLIETVSKERGVPRGIRLLADWENPDARAGDLHLYLERLGAEVAAEQEERRRLKEEALRAWAAEIQRQVDLEPEP
jgi:hypothetical protein